jgi:uncharacterized Zn finger protein (UPF0148 family)
MTAKAGERAQKTGDFYCATCGKKHVTKGDKIPECPNGHSQFDSRRNEPRAENNRQQRIEASWPNAKFAEMLAEPTRPSGRMLTGLHSSAFLPCVNLACMGKH